MRLQLSFFLFVLLLQVQAFALPHTIKMTTGKLQYVQATGAFELTVNFFVDDFEAALKKQYRLPALQVSGNNPQTLKIIQDYTSGKLHISVNSKELSFTVQEIKLIEENVLQVKYSFPQKINAKPAALVIVNQLLFEAYDDQVNILHVVVPEKEKVVLTFMPFEYRKKITF